MSTLARLPAARCSRAPAARWPTLAAPSPPRPRRRPRADAGARRRGRGPGDGGPPRPPSSARSTGGGAATACAAGRPPHARAGPRWRRGSRARLVRARLLLARQPRRRDAASAAGGRLRGRRPARCWPGAGRSASPRAAGARAHGPMAGCRARSDVARSRSAPVAADGARPTRRSSEAAACVLRGPVRARAAAWRLLVQIAYARESVAERPAGSPGSRLRAAGLSSGRLARPIARGARQSTSRLVARPSGTALGERVRDAVPWRA